MYYLLRDLHFITCLFHDFSMTLPWLFHDSSLTLPWLFLDSSMICEKFMTNSWQIHDTYMTLSWHIHDIFMTQLWHIHDTSWHIMTHSWQRERETERAIIQVWRQTNIQRYDIVTYWAPFSRSQKEKVYSSITSKPLVFPCFFLPFYEHFLCTV